MVQNFLIIFVKPKKADQHNHLQHPGPDVRINDVGQTTLHP